MLPESFNQGSKTAKTVRDICVIAETTVRNWYAMFRNGNEDLKDAPHSGHPVEFDEDRLNQHVHFI